MTNNKMFMSVCSTVLFVGALSIAGTADANGHRHGYHKTVGFSTALASDREADHYQRKYARGHFRGQGAKEIQLALELLAPPAYRGRGATFEAYVAPEVVQSD